jgi:peptide-methionine (S)-S-oxide reductase
VVATACGYAGGSFKNPGYEDVCSGRTGHAEVVEVEYDPSQLDYEELLRVFWHSHNPGRMVDPGYQYRSAIFCYSPEQLAAALASKEQLERKGKPIGTQIASAPHFYRAEE